MRAPCSCLHAAACGGEQPHERGISTCACACVLTKAVWCAWVSVRVCRCSTARRQRVGRRGGFRVHLCVCASCVSLLFLVFRVLHAARFARRAFVGPALVEAFVFVHLGLVTPAAGSRNAVAGAYAIGLVVSAAGLVWRVLCLAVLAHARRPRGFARISPWPGHSACAAGAPCRAPALTC